MRSLSASEGEGVCQLNYCLKTVRSFVRTECITPIERKNLIIASKVAEFLMLLKYDCRTDCPDVQEASISTAKIWNCNLRTQAHKVECWFLATSLGQLPIAIKFYWNVGDDVNVILILDAGRKHEVTPLTWNCLVLTDERVVGTREFAECGTGKLSSPVTQMRMKNTLCLLAYITLSRRLNQVYIENDIFVILSEVQLQLQGRCGNWKKHCVRKIYSD